MENKCVGLIKVRVWDKRILDFCTFHPKTSVLRKDIQSRDAQEVRRAPQSLQIKYDPDKA